MITLKIIPILPLSPGGLRPGRASGWERRRRGEGEHAMSTPIRDCVTMREMPCLSF